MDIIHNYLSKLKSKFACWNSYRGGKRYAKEWLRSNPSKKQVQDYYEFLLWEDTRVDAKDTAFCNGVLDILFDFV